MRWRAQRPFWLWITVLIVLGGVSLVCLAVAGRNGGETTRPRAKSTAIRTAAGSHRRYPASVSAYEIRTRQEQFYAHLVEPLIGDDDSNLADSRFLKMARKEIGGVLGDALSAPAIAEIITTSMPVDGQSPLQSINDLVGDCARVLCLSPPAVFVRNDPHPTAYVAGVKEPYLLVLTSGLLALFEGQPDELRFVVGHELGHVKCSHIRMKVLGEAVHTSLQTSADSNLDRTGMSKVLVPIVLGQFMTWRQEAEYSADRAGLLCCQSDQVAEQALLRLWHGLRRDSDWLDPAEGELDGERALAALREWQELPWVEFLVQVKQHSATHPFLPQRIVVLKEWSRSGTAEQILARAEKQDSEIRVNVEALLLTNLAEEGLAVNPYVRAIRRRRDVFGTPVQRGVRDAFWRDMSAPFVTGGDEPVFLEVYSSDFATDTLLGVCAVYPQPGKRVYETTLQWSERRLEMSRIAVAKVKMSVSSLSKAH